jgi:hypothetical protein
MMGEAAHLVDLSETPSDPPSLDHRFVGSRPQVSSIIGEAAAKHLHLQG